MCVVLQCVGVEIVKAGGGWGWGEGSTVLMLQPVGMETMTVGE